MLRVIIVEDELRAREFLRDLLVAECPQVQIAGIASNVTEAVTLINSLSPDLVFMDIELQTGTGFDVLEKIDATGMAVIFTTAYDHYAIKAIKFSAVDYLLKPIEIEELKSAVAKVAARLKTPGPQEALQMLLKNLQNGHAGEQSITLPTSDGLEFIPLRQIIRIEASGSYTHFFLQEKKKIMVSRHLKEYELMLDEHGFFRIHNSHIVNLAEVKRLIKTDGGYAVMNDGSEIGISPKKKDEFMRRIAARMV